MEIDVQNNSGLGKEAELPQEVRHFNWGAFLVTWIWGLCNNSYLTLISLGFNILTWILSIILGVIGFWEGAKGHSGIFIFCIFVYPALIFIGGLALRIWFGLKGNQWAWQNKKWNSTEHFNSVQKTWAIATCVVVFVVGFLYVGVVAAMTIPALVR